MRVLLLTVCVLAFYSSHGVWGGPSCFDHQTQTYTSMFGMQRFEQVASVTPFFSPGQSERVLAELVLSARESIDIAVPSWASFEPCGAWDGKGCSPAQVRNDARSPLFVALVNAIHRGVHARLLVGYCNTSVNAPGTIDEFSFLALTGADVRAYATTDFVHSKYLAVDGERVAIMSANIDLAAFRYNREAGVLYETHPVHPHSDRLINYTTAVFNEDWSRSIAYPVDANWSSSVLALIQDPQPIPMPPVVYFNSTCSYTVPDPPITVTDMMNVTVFALPDNGVEKSLIPHLRTATSSIDVYMYVIVSPQVIQELIALKKANPALQIRLLVSSFVVPGPFNGYPAGYNELVAANITVHVTNDCLGVHHIKIAFVDKAVVSVSTNNWAESEFPKYSVFPPHLHGADRGLVFRFEHPDIVAWYLNVMDHDWLRSIPWSPNLIPPPPPPPSSDLDTLTP